MVQTEIDRRLGALEKHEEESGAWHDRIIALEHQNETIVDWIEEQKDMQKRREDQHLTAARESRKQTITLIGFGITIVLGLLAIYFK